MIDAPTLPLPVIGGDELEEATRNCLRPGELREDHAGVPHRLPSFYYRVPSWEVALETRLAPNFGLWELIDVDVREAGAVRSFPRFVPCAITLLAGQLQLLRNELGRVIRVAANGGYRSPAHQLSYAASPHLWGTAANIYRIGDELLDTKEKVERYAQIARSVLPGAWVRRWGTEPGYAFDHLHVDIGYVVVEPHSRAASEPETNPGGEED